LADEGGDGTAKLRRIQEASVGLGNHCDKINAGKECVSGYCNQDSEKCVGCDTYSCADGQFCGFWSEGLTHCITKRKVGNGLSCQPRNKGKECVSGLCHPFFQRCTCNRNTGFGCTEDQFCGMGYDPDSDSILRCIPKAGRSFGSSCNGDNAGKECESGICEGLACTGLPGQLVPGLICVDDKFGVKCPSVFCRAGICQPVRLLQVNAFG
jgi:hypothetical protein